VTYPVDGVIQFLNNRGQDFWSVAFLSSKSFFRSVIYRIHSGQGFIGSLICQWVICKRIIGSMIRWVTLGEGSEINHCAQRFWPWITYVLHIWDPLPLLVDSICVVVSGLLKFKPVSACYLKWKSSENRQSASEVKIFEWVVQNFVSVLPQQFVVSYNSRILLHATFKMAPLAL